MFHLYGYLALQMICITPLDKFELSLLFIEQKLEFANYFLYNSKNNLRILIFCIENFIYLFWFQMEFGNIHVFS